MPAGSSAFIYATSDAAQSIPLTHSVDIEDNALVRNIDHLYATSPFYVRESGVYILFFVTADNEASQYTVFVNGVHAPYTSIGNNSGAGQIVNRQMLSLKKDDVVVVRNYSSEGGAITQSLKIGGMQDTADTTFLLMKIAPGCEEVKDRGCDEMYKLTRHEKTMYKKLLGDMIYDKDLMLKGFNVHGSFFQTGPQTINVESPVVYDNSQNVVGLEYLPATGEVRVSEDGVYKVFFLIASSIACQFTIFVNGAPVPSTTNGTNRGAGQLTVRALLALKKDDVISVRNHTSAETIILTGGTVGGKLLSIDAALTVFKVAPLTMPMIDPARWCKVNTECWNYKAFRQYLLLKKYLQIDGAQAYFSVSTATPQEVQIGEPFDFAFNQIVPYRAHHQQGTPQITIHRDGIYDIFADVISNQPAQLTVFVNNVPDVNTTFGRYSAGNRCYVRQFMKLRCGDVLTLRNYESMLGRIITAANPGGTEVGQVAMFMAFRLSAIDCKGGK